MLVLQRRVGEVLVIDGRIAVIVVPGHDGHLGLGIVAPREVLVSRGEQIEPGGKGYEVLIEALRQSPAARKRSQRPRRPKRDTAGAALPTNDKAA